MQTNSINKFQIIKRQQNFVGNSADSGSAKTGDANNSNTSPQKQGFFTKIMQHPSLIVVPFFPLGCYDTYASFRELFLSNQIKKSLEKGKAEDKLINFQKTSLKVNLALFLAAIPLYFITDYLNKKCKDKNFAKAGKQVEEFNKQNNTNLILAYSSRKTPNIVAASFNSISANLLLTEKVPEDMITANLKQKYIVKHELIHAKQHILMACSENGLNKMNYIAVKKVAKKLDEDKRAEVYDEYQKIQNSDGDKYKNKMVKINNYEVNYVDFMTALYKVIYDKETNPDKVPIIINKSFYQQAKAAKGPLTKAEEKKAQAYLEAYDKYPEKVGFFEAMNPNSEYYQNLLEKEAYKAIPWHIDLMMNLLCIF